MEMNQKSAVNRTYKSTIFTMLFEDKQNLLELYNAVSGKHYTNPEMLEINTLENAIYMSMKNDVSFLIDSRLSLYEHQSTYSPNLPVRFLLYISSLYSSITREMNLYGTKAVELPLPYFMIFYNGEQEEPDKKILRLSDLYSVKAEKYNLELEAVMLNINCGHNRELLATSQTLGEYAEYTARVRKYAKEMELEEAVDRAIEECIQEGILRKFLEKNKMEAKNMSIFEYDQERHIKMERAEAWEDGRKEGKIEGKLEGEQEMLRKIVEKKLKKGKKIKEIAEDLEEAQEAIRKVIEELNADRKL